MSADDIRELLSFDALATAEGITGESYKVDRETMGIGFGLHLAYARRKEAALKSTCDSWFGMNLADTLALHNDLGFTTVLRDEFTGRGDVPETYTILWHPDGLLATVESHGTTRRNMSKLYYNFEFASDVEDRYGYTSSGHFHRESYDAGRLVYVGDHDTREGLRNTIQRFGMVGAFLPTWVERPFLWLLTYADTDVEGYDYAAIHAERIGRLPADVQAAIAGVTS